MSSVEEKATNTFKPDPLLIISALVLAGVSAWTYAYTIEFFAYIWWKPDYQHGFLVIPFCLFLLWYRRDMMKSIPAQGSWWGLAFFAICAGMRLAGTYFNYTWLQHGSLVPGVAGIVLFVGGWQTLLWAWPSLVFLIFMIPLPGFLTDFMSQPLQKWGSSFTVYTLQTLGLPAMNQDVAIVLRDRSLNVVEACSGLKMLMLFFALCTGAAFIMDKKPLWERLLIVVSAVPIAVAANVCRLTLTALLGELALWTNWFTPEHATEWMHDFAGLLMMPIALLMVWLEWTIISNLFIEEPKDRTTTVRGTTRGLLMAAAPAQEAKKP